MAKKKTPPKTGEDRPGSKMFPGRPPTYDKDKDLQDAIVDYFDNGVEERNVQIGKGDSPKVEKIKVPTITGLALHLGFASRQSIYDYEEKEEFAYTIKRARTFIEKNYEELLHAGNVTGAIFALKNFGWTDKQQHELTGADGGAIKYSNIERAKRLDAILDGARKERDRQSDTDE